MRDDRSRSGGIRTVVAIDGPAGVGKSTVARRLAERLALPYLDTGAMYRCVALSVLEREVDPTDSDAVMACARETRLDLRIEQDGRATLLRGGRPVGGEIRTEKVSAMTSRVAALAELRRWLVAMQRDFGRRFGGVVEGRDIGSVVFPDTPFKFFLEAPVAVRAERRAAQLAGRDDVNEASEAADELLSKVRRDLEIRDRQDREREVAPLRVDESYTVIDTGSRTVDDVVELLAARVEETRARRLEPSRASDDNP